MLEELVIEIYTRLYIHIYTHTIMLCLYHLPLHAVSTSWVRKMNPLAVEMVTWASETVRPLVPEDGSLFRPWRPRRCRCVISLTNIKLIECTFKTDALMHQNLLYLLCINFYQKRYAVVEAVSISSCVVCFPCIHVCRTDI
jgi:hypothetical protein